MERWERAGSEDERDTVAQQEDNEAPPTSDDDVFTNPFVTGEDEEEDDDEGPMTGDNFIRRTSPTAGGTSAFACTRTQSRIGHGAAMVWDSTVAPGQSRRRA